MAVKILATGDIHLGKRSADVPENTEKAATTFTWQRMVSYAIDNKLDAILLSGDIVDEENKFFEANNVFAEGCQQLDDNNIPVVLVAGNHDHDVLPEIIKTNTFSNIHLLGEKGSWELKTLDTKNGQIQIAGWSFPSGSVTYNPFTKFNLKDINPNVPVIGLLHADYGVSNSLYSPVQEKDFLNKHIELWILGHIHKPDVMSEHPIKIIYPGSPHALSAKEPGIHGPVVLNIEDKNRITHKWLDFSPVKYEHLSIDTGTPDSLNDIRSIILTDIHKKANAIETQYEHLHYLIFDVELSGKFNDLTKIPNLQQEITEQPIIEHADLTVSVRKLINKLKPVVENLSNLAKQSSPAGVLADTILKLENGKTTPFADKLMEKWKKKQIKVISWNTYFPLYQEHMKNNANTDIEAREYILESCNHLLDALLLQTKNSQS